MRYGLHLYRCGGHIVDLAEKPIRVKSSLGEEYDELEYRYETVEMSSPYKNIGRVVDRSGQLGGDPPSIEIHIE